jgi:hypothetical protein
MLNMVVWNVRAKLKRQKPVATLAQSIVNGLSGTNMAHALKSVEMVSRSGLVEEQSERSMVVNHVKDLSKRKRIAMRVSALLPATSQTG